MGVERWVGDRRIDWSRVIERLIYLFPPVIGVGVVGVLREAEPGVPLLERGLVLFGTFGYTALALGLVLALFFDARELRERAEWFPQPWLASAGALAVAPFALAPFAGVAYLYRRYELVGATPGWSGWWLVVALSLGATAFGVLAAVIGLLLSVPGLIATGIGLAGAIAFGSFPIAIHQDAAYVASREDSWRPNPALYLGVALASLFVAPLQPLLAVYYLARRRRALGTP